MSALGHKHTVRRANAMSGLPPKADISLASKVSPICVSIIAAKPPNDKDG